MLLNMVRNIDDVDSSCVAALLDYFSSVIGLEILGLEGLYPHFLILSLKWLRTDAVSSDSLKLISNIVTDLFIKESVNTPPEKEKIIDGVRHLLDEHLSVINIFHIFHIYIQFILLNIY